MAIVSFLQTELHAGTINTDATFSKQQNFASPVTLWSSYYLQEFSVNDDDGGVGAHISQFKDNTGTHNGNIHPGLFAAKCTSVTFFMATNDCIATLALTTMIFG